MPSGGYVPGSYFTRRAMDSTSPSGHEPETSFRYQDPRGEESYVPEYLKRKWNPSDLLPDFLSEPLAGFREKVQNAGQRQLGGLDQQTKYDLNLSPEYRQDPITGDPSNTYTRMGGSKTPWLQKQLNKVELPFDNQLGDVVRSEVEEEALGPAFKVAKLGGKAALKSIMGHGGASLAGVLPTSGYRRDILKIGDVINQRFNPDTRDLEKRMRLLESSGPESLVTGFHNRLTSPGGHKELEEITDLADLPNPEEDITDEMARRMAVWGNSPAPPRRGSFPGLSPTTPPLPTGGTHKTREEIAGGPIIDYGRFNLSGIMDKTVHEGPGGQRWLEKGGLFSRDDFGDVTGYVEPPSSSARESGQTQIMDLLGGDTPLAHRIEGGGTMQQFLGPEYKGWRSVNPYHGPSLVKNPAIANQLAAEQARDVFGSVTDRHTGQFMFDPVARKAVGVDKGFGRLEDYGFRGRLFDPEQELGQNPHVYSPIDMYSNIAKGGPLEGLVDPDTYQRMAALGLSVPQSDWQRTLEPLMRGSQADKDTQLRNFMRSIQGMPQHLQQYYDTFVKP